jgi:hypothetical protein
LETVVKIIEEEMFSWRQEGGRRKQGNSRNVWGELEKAGWTKERNYDRLCELKAESGSCPTGLKSAFGF